MIKKILFILLLTISSLGFSQEKSIDGLSAAPNPFSNSTNINFTSTSESKVIFSVKNILGKTVFKKTYTSEKGKNSFLFFKNDLLVGMYIYSIQDKNNMISKRFVIK